MLLMLDLDDGNRSTGLDWGMRTECRCSKVDQGKTERNMMIAMKMKTNATKRNDNKTDSD